MKTIKHLFVAFAIALAAFSGPAPASAALNNANLAVASVGAGTLPTLWSYKTTDAITDLDVSNYWGGAPAQMKAGDFVYAKCSDGGVMLIVSAISHTASTSTATAVGSGANGGRVWIEIPGTTYGTAGAVGWGLAPVAGTVTKAWHVVTTATDADVALNLDGGGTNMTGTLTITNADAAGTIDTATISGSNTVTAGEKLSVESDGAGTAGAGTTYILIEE